MAQHIAELEAAIAAAQTAVNLAFQQHPGVPPEAFYGQEPMPAFQPLVAAQNALHNAQRQLAAAQAAQAAAPVRTHGYPGRPYRPATWNQLNPTLDTPESRMVWDMQTYSGPGRYRRRRRRRY